jgi:glucose/arabinose dehydrogenase
MGIRNSMGLVIHPETGELWECENGPQGGDELNIIRAGKNYGWPVISYGRSYSGDLTGDTGPVQEQPVKEGMEQPLLFWSPSIALSGMLFYTGDRFPEWKGSIFLGALVGEQLQHVVMNQKGLPVRREALLRELKQRIRDVRQGPDGLLYLLTDEGAGALLRIEPVQDRNEHP